MLNLDDELKQAQIAKIHAEIGAIKYTPWIELIKLFGSFIVGSVSVLVAYNQYESAKTAKAAEVTAKEAERAVKNELAEVEESKDELKESFAIQKSKPELAQAHLVYIQFQGDTRREFINELRKYLQKGQYNAPGAERVSGNYASQIKYFYTSDDANSSDKETAGQLARYIEGFYSSRKCNIALSVTPILAEKISPIEVWLSAKDYCK